MGKFVTSHEAFAGCATIIDVSDETATALNSVYIPLFHISEMDASFANVWRFGDVALVNGRELYGRYSTERVEALFRGNLRVAMLADDPITQELSRFASVMTFINMTTESWEVNK